MAMSPTTDPSVAAAIIPALEAGKQITDTLLNLCVCVCGGIKIEFSVCTHR